MLSVEFNGLCPVRDSPLVIHYFLAINAKEIIHSWMIGCRTIGRFQMTQRLLRFGVAQCFQGPAQLSLDFRGKDYLVRRGTLCEHRTRERHCGEEECKGCNILRSSEDHSHFTCGRVFFAWRTHIADWNNLLLLSHQTLDTPLLSHTR